MSIDKPGIQEDMYLASVPEGKRPVERGANVEDTSTGAALPQESGMANPTFNAGNNPYGEETALAATDETSGEDAEPAEETVE